VTLFLTLFSVGIAFGSLLCNRLLAGRLSASSVPWGALGIGLFSIDLWMASPPPPGAAELTTFLAFLGDPLHWRVLADLFGIAASGGVFVVPLYALLQAMNRTRAPRPGDRGEQHRQCRCHGDLVGRDDGADRIRRQHPRVVLLTGTATVAVAVLFWRMLPLLTVAQTT